MVVQLLTPAFRYRIYCKIRGNKNRKSYPLISLVQDVSTLLHVQTIIALKKFSQGIYKHLGKRGTY